MTSLKFHHKSASGKRTETKVYTAHLLFAILLHVSPSETLDALLVSVQRFILTHYTVSFHSQLSVLQRSQGGVEERRELRKPCFLRTAGIVTWLFFEKANGHYQAGNL